MKLAITISDASHYVHAGGETQRISHIFEVADDTLPLAIREFLKAKNEETPQRPSFLSASISFAI